MSRPFPRVNALGMNRLIAGILEAAQHALLSYGWPGNVRELRNVIERAVILEPSQTIQLTSLRLHS